MSTVLMTGVFGLRAYARPGKTQGPTQYYYHHGIEAYESYKVDEKDKYNRIPIYGTRCPICHQYYWQAELASNQYLTPEGAINGYLRRHNLTDENQASHRIEGSEHHDTYYTFGITYDFNGEKNNEGKTSEYKEYEQTNNGTYNRALMNAASLGLGEVKGKVLLGWSTDKIDLVMSEGEFYKLTGRTDDSDPFAYVDEDNDLRLAEKKKDTGAETATGSEAGDSEENVSAVSRYVEGGKFGCFNYNPVANGSSQNPASWSYTQESPLAARSNKSAADFYARGNLFQMNESKYPQYTVTLYAVWASDTLSGTTRDLSVGGSGEEKNAESEVAMGENDTVRYKVGESITLANDADISIKGKVLIGWSMDDTTDVLIKSPDELRVYGTYDADDSEDATPSEAGSDISAISEDTPGDAEGSEAISSDGMPDFIRYKLNYVLPEPEEEEDEGDSVTPSDAQEAVNLKAINNTVRDTDTATDSNAKEGDEEDEEEAEEPILVSYFPLSSTIESMPADDITLYPVMGEDADGNGIVDFKQTTSSHDGTSSGSSGNGSGSHGGSGSGSGSGGGSNGSGSGGSGGGSNTNPTPSTQEKQGFNDVTETRDEDENNIVYGSDHFEGDSSSNTEGKEHSGFATSDDIKGGGEEKTYPKIDPSLKEGIDSGTWNDDGSYRSSSGELLKGGFALIKGPEPNESGSFYWYYFDEQGRLGVGWIRVITKASSSKASDETTEWYYSCEEKGPHYGAIEIGWIYCAEDGRTYYMSEADARMLSGWVGFAEGKGASVNWYYFKMLKDTERENWFFGLDIVKWVYDRMGFRSYGALYTNEVTPDGYETGPNGLKIS